MAAMSPTVAVDADLLERLLCDAQDRELQLDTPKRVQYQEHDPIRRAIAVARMNDEQSTPRPFVCVVEHIAEHSLGDGVIGVFANYGDAVKAMTDLRQDFTESFRTKEDIVFTRGNETIVITRQDIGSTQKM